MTDELVAPCGLTHAEELLWKNRFAELSREEFQYMLAFCGQHNLDPWLRPVFPVFRHDAAKKNRTVDFELSIEGIRTLAHRTGLYVGNEAVQSTVDADGRLVSCTACVYRLAGGQRALYASTVHWSERYQDTEMWRKMPHTMLGKCAEAAALRAAFPEQLGGVYVEGELKRASGTRPAALTAAEQVDANGVEPDDNTPTSKMQFELRLIHDFGFGKPGERAAMLATMREKYGHLLRVPTDEEPLRFYATVLFLLGSEPEKYGVKTG